MLPEATLAGAPRASGILCYLVLLLLAAFLFGRWPGVDLAVSSLARDLSGGGFQPSDGWWWWLYAGMRPFFWAFSAAVALIGLAARLLGRPVLGLTLRRAIFLLLCFALIQGLVVDAYLKIAFGRARPRDIVEFGGALTFTPFYIVTDQCLRNCSFVSGHAAMAFATLAFAFVVPPAWRRRVFWAALAFGAATSWMRILQGAHFLSDVVFAGLVVYGCTWLLSLLVLRRAWPAWRPLAARAAAT